MVNEYIDTRHTYRAIQFSGDIRQTLGLSTYWRVVELPDTSAYPLAVEARYAVLQPLKKSDWIVWSDNLGLVRVEEASIFRTHYRQYAGAK